MTRGAFLFPALILAFTAAMLALGYFHYHYSWTSFAFPLGAGLVLCALCAFELTSAARHPDAKRAQELPSLSLVSLAWLFALAAFLWAFGFVFGAALYLLVSLRGNAFSWRTSVIAALVSLFVGWGLVIKILGVQLPIKPLWLG